MCFAVRVLLGQQGLLLAHMHCQVKHFSLAKQTYLHAPQVHSEVNTMRGIKSRIVIVVVVLMNNWCLAFKVDLLCRVRHPPSHPLRFIGIFRHNQKLPHFKVVRAHSAWFLILVSLAPVDQSS